MMDEYADSMGNCLGCIPMQARRYSRPPPPSSLVESTYAGVGVVHESRYTLTAGRGDVTILVRNPCVVHSSRKEEVCSDLDGEVRRDVGADEKSSLRHSCRVASTVVALSDSSVTVGALAPFSATADATLEEAVEDEDEEDTT